MKGFFKTFFASLLAVVAGSGCLVLIVFFVLIGAIAKALTFGEDTEPVNLVANTVLKVDIGELSEIVQEDPVASFLDSSEASPVSLSTAISAIKKAKNNPNIEAIYLNVEGLSGGMASVDALRRALVDFKASGKPIIAYSDNFSQKAYYLSSIADYVVLNPLGSVSLVGVSSSSLMMKGALDKLGVKMEIFRVGTFKSAVEPYMLNEMSEANRKQTQEYVDGLWSSIVSGVAEARGIEADSLLAFVDRGGAFGPADSFVQAGLVDTVAYRSDVEGLFASRLGIEADDLRMISLSDMALQPEVAPRSSSHRIKVIFAEGEITDATSDIYSGATTTIGYSLATDLKEAAEDSSIHAVVLRVNSPGGSAFLSDQIWNEVTRLKAKKPIVVSMGDVAASGGYYIAAPASKIVAEANTLTGSIGIFGLIPNFSQIASDFGLHLDVVKSSRYADMEMGLGLRPLTDGQRVLIQREVERGYEIFLSRVAQGRGMTRDQVDSVAQGRVWLGSRALELGLVDKLGGLDVAIEEAAKLAELPDYRVDYGTTKLSLLDELLKSETPTTDFIARLRGALLSSEERELLRLLRAGTRYAGIQARLPYEFVAY